MIKLFVKFFSFTALFLFVFLLSITAQLRKHFCIKGSLKGLKDRSMLFLIRERNSLPDTIHKVFSEGESFLFTIDKPMWEEAYFIKIAGVDSLRKGPVNSIDYITLLLGNDSIELQGDINDLSLDGISVSRSSLHEEFRKFRTTELAMYIEMNSKIIALDEQFGSHDIRDTDFEKREARYKIEKAELARIDSFYEEWISSHLNSPITPWIIKRNGASARLVWMQNNWNRLSLRAQGSKYGQELLAAIKNLKETRIGVKAPRFTFPMESGRMLSLREVVSNARVTIIDFWASWCKPCRSEFPAMKALFVKYEKMGLKIIGYSIDKDKKQWLKALKEENLPWYNIRETNQFALEKYKVEEIPTTFILNKKGEIIAKGLRGADLEHMLKELFENNTKLGNRLD